MTVQSTENDLLIYQRWPFDLLKMTAWSIKDDRLIFEDDLSIYPSWPTDINFNIIWPHDVVLNSKIQENVDNKSYDFSTLRTQYFPQIIFVKLFDFFTLS